MRRLTVVAAALAVALTSACTSGDDTAAPQAAPSTSAAPTDQQLSEQALAVKPPKTIAPERVEDNQLDDRAKRFERYEADDAYPAAVKHFTLIRQLPSLLVSRPKVEADFKRVLDVSAPEHDAFLKEQIALYLDSADNGGSRTDAEAEAAGDTLKSAISIFEATEDGAGAGEDGADTGSNVFSHFDPETGAFAPIRISRTAAYEFTGSSGRQELAIAFDAVVPYNVIGVDGQKQTAQITITDFRMVMQRVGTIWEWDGWDLVDAKVELLPRA